MKTILTYESQLPNAGPNMEEDRFITITLRPSENPNKVAAELRMLSSVLKQCSKYFEVALAERWNNPSSSIMILSLEMISGIPVECYTECFKRMYQPLKKGFQNVESSLHLLRVASQIDYDKLTIDICGYLSATLWSKEEELQIRQYVSAQDFPGSQAKDLKVRLSLDGSTRISDRKKLGDVVEETIRIALGRGRSSPPTMSMEEARSFFDEQFASIRQSVPNPGFYMDMMSIVNSATKELLVEFEEHCRQHGLGKVVGTEPHLIPGFEPPLEAICWILDKLIKANVAEEGVGWFLQLELYPNIFEAAAVFSNDYRHIVLAIDIARLVLLMHRKAASGELVLKESARVELFRRWDLIKAYQSFSHYFDVMFEMAIPQVREDEMMSLPAKKRAEVVVEVKEALYHTLSLGKQIELVQEGVCNRPSCYIEPRSLARLVKRKWAAS